MYLPLTDRETAALRALARLEDRDPRIQAARFVREALNREGLLTDESLTAPEQEPIEATQ